MSHRTSQSAATTARALCATGTALLLWLGAWNVSGSNAHASDPSAAFVVIVHPKNALGSVTLEFVAQVFLKRATRWSDGQTIRPVDLRPDSSVRRAFSDSVLKRSVSAVRSYWQQRIFSGRELPPPELDSDDAVVHFVASSPGAIGYISAAKHPSEAKVLSVR